MIYLQEWYIFFVKRWGKRGRNKPGSFIIFRALRQQKMNFNQLRYIIAVDQYRNFTRAATECGIAQSTLSREIQRLEKEFRVMIFDRSRYPVTTTMKGVDLIRQAKIILAAKKEFEEIARKRTNVPEGDFRLGILPVLAPYLLPLFIRSLSLNYPALHIEIMELTRQEMVYHFEEGRLDGAIVIAPFVKEGFYEEVLFEEEFILYLEPEHPLLELKELDWDDLSAGDLLLHETFKNYLLPSLKPYPKDDNGAKSFQNINYHSGSLETIRKIIDRSGGMTILPRLSGLYMGERRIRQVRPFSEPGLHRKIMLVTPRGFEKNRITKVIVKEILDHLPEGFLPGHSPLF